MQLSILSQLRTAELAEANGLDVRVVDVGFFPLSEAFLENREQMPRVEQSPTRGTSSSARPT